MQYIQGEACDLDKAFMFMREVGPYSTNTKKHMKNLAVLILAFSREKCS